MLLCTNPGGCWKNKQIFHDKKHISYQDALAGNTTDLPAAPLAREVSATSCVLVSHGNMNTYILLGNENEAMYKEYRRQSLN